MIIVTGAAGFIGSAIIWALNKKGIAEILAVDSAPMLGLSKNLSMLAYADFMDKDEFIDKLERGLLNQEIQGIIHMGACSSTTETNEDYLRQNNTEYTKRLAQWCLKNNKRFVYASSAATYGDGSAGFSDDHGMINRLQPLNLYGKSKQWFDAWALDNGVLSRIAGLKYFNVYGPDEYHKGEMRSVVHKAFGQINQTGKVKLFKSYNAQFKDGWQLRDFIYVKDAVDMTLFVYDNPRINGIFNIGTGKTRSFFDLVVAIFRAIGKEPKIEYVDMPESIREKYQYFTQAEMGKLLKTGYRKRISTLEEGVDDYVKNYLLANTVYLKSKMS